MTALRYGLAPLIARLLLIAEFGIAANGKISDWPGQAAYMASHGMTFVKPLLATALAIEVVGSLCVAFGFRARAAAAVMFVYLGIVSVRLHDFWNVPGGGMAETQFFKNVGMMGGLLLLAVFGAGQWSLDARRQARSRSTSS